MIFTKRLVLFLGLLATAVACETTPFEKDEYAGEKAADCKEGQSHLLKKTANDCPIEDATPEKHASFETMRKACAADIKKLCQDIDCPTLMKPVQVCLMTESSSLSAVCKKDINRHIEKHQPYIKTLD